MPAFDDPWVLALLPLALLPLLADTRAPLASGWLAFVPRDAVSRWLSALLHVAAVGAPAALIVAIAGPHLPETEVERIGRGAEIVLVLDRSRSMDQGFAPDTAPPPGVSRYSPEALTYYMSQTPGRARESKGAAARRLLAEFAAHRSGDRFALVSFSTLPMRVLGFTQSAEAVQAAIAAGNVGRGLAETQIGLALDAALDAFEGRPYAGSRIVMLVSDGGDRLDPAMREHLADRLRRERVGLYWMYLRSINSPGLKASEEAGERAGEGTPAADSLPEPMLHAFFKSLSTPYTVYEASDTRSLEQAIADVDRLERLPIAYRELLPRRDLAAWGYAAAFVLVLVLLAARKVEILRWA